LLTDSVLDVGFNSVGTATKRWRFEKAVIKRNCHVLCTTCRTDTPYLINAFLILLLYKLVIYS